MRLQLTIALAAAASMQTKAFTTTSKFATPRRQTSTLHVANPVKPTSEVPVKSTFLTPESAKDCIDLVGSPLYAYSLERLDKFSDDCLAFPNAYGLTVRFAMKSCPNSAILKFFDSKNIHIDASSGFECRRAMDAGIPADHISLSSQELPSDFAELIDMGVKINCW